MNLSELGFVKSVADDCLYIKRVKNAATVIVLAYVDDMSVAGPKVEDIVEFKHEINKRFEVTDLGELKS